MSANSIFTFASNFRQYNRLAVSRSQKAAANVEIPSRGGHFRVRKVRYVYQNGEMFATNVCERAMIIYNAVKRYLGQLRIIRWIDAREWIEYNSSGHFVDDIIPENSSNLPATGDHRTFSVSSWKIISRLFSQKTRLKTTRNGKVFLTLEKSSNHIRNFVVKQNRTTVSFFKNIFTSRSRRRNNDTLVVENGKNLNAFEIELFEKSFS